MCGYHTRLLAYVVASVFTCWPSGHGFDFISHWGKIQKLAWASRLTQHRLGPSKRIWEVKVGSITLITSPIECRLVYKISGAVPYAQYDYRWGQGPWPLFCTQWNHYEQIPIIKQALSEYSYSLCQVNTMKMNKRLTSCVHLSSIFVVQVYVLWYPCCLTSIRGRFLHQLSFLCIDLLSPLVLFHIMLWKFVPNQANNFWTHI